MAGLREIALGITAVLQNDEPEPLGVDLANHSPDQATFLVKAVIDECVDGDIRLHLVRMDRGMWRPSGLPDEAYRGVPLDLSPRLGALIEFQRWR